MRGDHLEAVGEEGGGDEDLLLGHLHELAPADDRADGVAVGHGLAEGAEVGRDAVALLCSAHRDAEARAHFVEDEDGAVLGGELAYALEIARGRVRRRGGRWDGRPA